MCLCLDAISKFHRSCSLHAFFSLSFSHYPWKFNSKSLSVNTPSRSELPSFIWSPRKNQPTSISLKILGRIRKDSPSIQTVRPTQSVVPIHQWVGEGDQYRDTFWWDTPTKHSLQLCQAFRWDELNRQSHWIVKNEPALLVKWSMRIFFS